MTPWCRKPLFHASSCFISHLGSPSPSSPVLHSSLPFQQSSFRSLGSVCNQGGTCIHQTSTSPLAPSAQTGSLAPQEYRRGRRHPLTSEFGQPAWTSPVVLSWSRVGMAVLLIAVATDIPVTDGAGAPVGIKLVAREEGSVVKITVKMTLFGRRSTPPANEDMYKRQ